MDLNMTIRGILFDKDGTLLDYHATWTPLNRAVARIVAGGDEDLAQDLLKYGGQDDAAGIVEPGSLLAASNTHEIAQAWTKLVPDHGQENLTKLMDDVFQRDGAETAVPIDGLRDCIQALNKHGLKLGVATSDSESGAVATLSPFDVLPFFDFIAGYDSGHGVKPGPGMVQGFCKACDLNVTNVAVVGDNIHDLEMGKAAGAGVVVGVLSGTSSAEDLEPLADFVLKDISMLANVLDLNRE
jgi:phosphoglycolate phosphatase